MFTVTVGTASRPPMMYADGRLGAKRPEQCSTAMGLRDM